MPEQTQDRESGGGAGGMPDLSGDGPLAQALISPGSRDGRAPRMNRNCRDVTRILGLSGCLKPEEVRGLIRGGAKLAADAIAKNRVRSYRAAMSVLIAAAKLEQSDDPEATPEVIVQNAIRVYLPHNGRDEPLNVVDAPMVTIQPVDAPSPASTPRIRLPTNGRDP